MSHSTAQNSYLPTEALMRRKTRCDLLNWKQNCERKAAEFADRTQQKEDFFDQLAQSMAEKANIIETFLRKNPDHYGIEKDPPPRYSQHGLNPFRYHQGEIEGQAIGPNGRTGYPIPPGEKGPQDRKRKAELLQIAAEEAKVAVKKMKLLQEELRAAEEEEKEKEKGVEEETVKPQHSPQIFLDGEI